LPPEIEPKKSMAIEIADKAPRNCILIILDWTKIKKEKKPRGIDTYLALEIHILS
jgi:hypothetical protein